MTDFKKMNQEEFETLVASKGKAALAWYIEQLKTEVPTKVYPRIKNAEGKSVVDKNQEPKIEMRAKSFIAIKSEFATKFAPQLAPKAKEKAPSRDDRISRLESLLNTL